MEQIYTSNNILSFYIEETNDGKNNIVIRLTTNGKLYADRYIGENIDYTLDKLTSSIINYHYFKFNDNNRLVFFNNISGFNKII